MPILRSLRLPHLYRGPLKRALGLCTGIGVLLILTGCGTQPTPPEPTLPSNQPSVESPTSTTTEPEPTKSSLIEPPMLPEAAKENSEEGAIAFTEYFVDVLSYSAKTLDKNLLTQITTESCTFCDRMSEYLQQTRQTDGQLAGLSFSLSSPPTIVTAKEGVYALAIQLEQSSHTRIVDTESAKFEGAILDGVTIVSYEPEGWLLHKLGESTE